jgi:hypothetical protein
MPGSAAKKPKTILKAVNIMRSSGKILIIYLPNCSQSANAVVE